MLARGDTSDPTAANLAMPWGMHMAHPCHQSQFFLHPTVGPTTSPGGISNSPSTATSCNTPVAPVLHGVLCNHATIAVNGSLVRNQCRTQDRQIQTKSVSSSILLSRTAACSSPASVMCLYTPPAGAGARGACLVC
jgi:hypothetical protein